MIHMRDVLTEKEWFDIRFRMPGPPMQMIERKRDKRGRSRSGCRWLPYPEDQNPPTRSRDEA